MWRGDSTLTKCMSRTLDSIDLFWNCGFNCIKYLIPSPYYFFKKSEIWNWFRCFVFKVFNVQKLRRLRTELLIHKHGEQISISFGSFIPFIWTFHDMNAAFCSQLFMKSCKLEEKKKRRCYRKDTELLFSINQGNLVATLSHFK